MRIASLILAVPALGLFAAPVQRGASLPAERLFEAIGAQPGSTICEIGAGGGEMSLAAARLVGSSGRVYASELGEARVRKLRDSVAASPHTNITVVAGAAEKTNLPENGCDGIFLRDVYHHLTDPAAMNRSIFDALKEGGRVVVVDFTPPGKEAEHPAGRARDGQHGVYPETVSREMKEAGFEPLSSEAPVGRWFITVFAKPKR